VVRRVEPRTPHLIAITLAGDELDGLTVAEPAASVRLLLPAMPGRALVVPRWNGNEFLLPDGHRPALRTFTPRRVDADALELDIEVVVHGDGVASQWAAAAIPGWVAAISGPGRGYTIDHEAPAFLLAGDESAIPAISQLLEQLPAVPTEVHIEVSRPDARLALPDHSRAVVSWHDLAPGEPTGSAFAAAVRAADLPDGVRVWVAGEAAAVQRVRRYLFDERALSRAQTTVRGYWKHGRAGAVDDDER
jgi:NADPH-dependent ferric siderophore reductase